MELGFAADDVVEGFALPEGAGAVEGFVDVVGAAAFPVADDFAEGAVLGGFDEGVEVVGHDAPSIKLIGGAVTGEESRDEEVGAGGAGEEAFAVAGVEQLVELVGELAVILVAFVVGEAREVFGGADAVGLEPGIALASPLGGEGGGDGIGKSRGDEVSGAPLPPMREVLAMDVRLGERVVRHERHGKECGASARTSLEWPGEVVEHGRQQSSAEIVACTDSAWTRWQRVGGRCCYALKRITTFASALRSGGSKVVQSFSSHRLGMGEKAASRRAVLLRAKAHNYVRKRTSQRRQQSSAGL